jgi:hypothetical protein
MQRVRYIFFVTQVLAYVLSACSAPPTQVQPTLAPTKIILSEQPLGSGDLPQSDAEVPRVSVEEARAALESGRAFLVDVRSPSAFEASHIAGAISIPLGAIERNPTDLAIGENQWIITYCT